MSVKNIIILLIAVVILGGIIFYGYSQIGNKSDLLPVDQKLDLANGPSIEIINPNYDFGVVKYGDVVTHKFIIKNKGSQPLEIARLSTSCGCTSASMAEADKIIPAGESREMIVSFDPAVHKDDTDLGELTRIIYVKTNDPAQPEVEAQIEANVLQPERFKTIKVTARQWKFEPNPIVVNQGDFVRLEIKSADVAHGFALPDFGIDEMIEPGQTTVVEFLADRAGAFGFYCSIPCGSGHSGMRAQLIIK